MDQNSSRKYVFCYGYNHPQQIAKLTERPLKEVLEHSIPCKLKGYKRAFGRGSYSDKSYATIVEDEHSEIKAYATGLREEDYEYIDRFEGYPDFYDRILAEVETQDGQKLEVFVYKMNDDSEFTRPTNSYLYQCAKTSAAYYYLQNKKFDYSKIKVEIIKSHNEEHLEDHEVELELEDYPEEIHHILKEYA